MALGKIKADTLEHSTAGSLDTQYVVGGSAKVWVNWKGTDTVGLNGSLNVSSGADLGTANYQINYSSAMGNVNYSVGLGTNRQDDSADHTFSNFYANTTALLKGRAFNTGASALDQAKWTANIHGDLA